MITLERYVTQVTHTTHASSDSPLVLLNTNLSFGGESQGRSPVVHYLAGKSCGEPRNDPRPNPSSSLAPAVGTN